MTPTTAPSEKSPLLIVGLGNPGKEYENTRHNAGQQAIARLYARHAETLDWGPERGAFLAKGKILDRRVILMTPAEFYMNESGGPVGKVATYYKIQPQQVLVIYDDKEIPLGKLRLRASGSAGGHNGMRSIIERMGTEDVPRLRIGIGSELGEQTDAAKFVLGKLTRDEASVMFDALNVAADAVETVIKDGLEEAMNVFNR